MNQATFGFEQRPRLGGAPAGVLEGQVETTPILTHYASLFWRRRRVVGGIIAAFVVVGLIVTLLMTPQYTATSEIEIRRETAQIVNMQGVEQDASDADQEFYQTQYGLLRAQSLAEKVAGELQLADNAQFFEMFEPDQRQRLFGENGNPATDRETRLRAAGAILLDNVRISPERQSRLVEIDFTAPSPEMARNVANAWAEGFIESNLERRYEASSYARDFLENRLATLRTRLDESELNLQNYAQDERIVTLPGAGRDGSEQSTVAFDLVALNEELSEATADRITAQGRLQSVRGRAGESTESLNNSALNQLRAQRAELSGEYEKLLQQFEPAYPPARALQRQIAEVDRSIQREERRVGSSVELAYQAAREREQALRQEVNALEGQFLDQRRRSIQYRVLGRDVDTNRQLYDALLQRYKEIGIAGGVGTNNVSIVDRADIPQRPSSPRLLLNLVLSLFAGVTIGAIAAFLLEQSDETMSDPSEAERLIGLPLLGSVPRSDEEPGDALLDPKSQLVDAYLAIQTSLQFATESGIPRAIAVTSTRPGEGKSTTSLALATMLARAQKRVVLIDGDMRSPSVHHLIGTDHDRGLSTYLSGNASAAELMHKVDRYGFFAITAGPIPPNAAELLTGNRLATLLTELSDDFDHVIIDAPPVMGLADVPLIAGRVDGIVYAVEAHGIRLGMVRAALQRIAATSARILGTVVTKFEPKRSSKGYGYTYEYEYGDKQAAAKV
ncbi:GumC family protein [Qipengyuania spongiae]|uniref:Polysaccharide biosynthesis tyrosine autokinase n=1 Tax=Qipengyuania spongiae TaxID=2909673 RepID=A0ABY5T6D1_9SPHN|nr:polysaccharide biosynthesis tyrosine autokinase [Qipengyuania spongiae]UVI40846.1 polysaccharide biosynthesis tyrosine autokinase [Qipengyuania spongiae]